MSKIDYDLNKIKGIAFDIDGVLSPALVPLGPDGIPVRMANVKDGYAIQRALKSGLRLCIITGADSPMAFLRYNALGIADVFTKASSKLPILRQWIDVNGFSAEEVAYVGDDLPDYECMRFVGLPVAPVDASVEVKEIARYITKCAGGYGVARDLIEEILRSRGEWLTDPFCW